MVTTLLRTYLTFILICLTGLSYGQKFGFSNLLEKSPDDITVFCVPNNVSNIALLQKEAITIKYSSQSWVFINASPKWIDEHIKDGSLDNFYFEYAPPHVLADSSRMHHNVNQVHAGLAPLESSYTGAGVIIGVIDQGLDWSHPDFIDSNGNTRVLKYWDQANNGSNPPLPYGYGQEWSSAQINAGTCTSTEEASAHGTTVAGLAAGNGRANGQNKGMAPDSKIIIVESNFNSPNWTLTIADGIDYIFKQADLFNMPAVVNLSLGTYFGSHDGNDPSSEIIENLLDEKGGRIVVSAAGNSGAKGKFHQQNTVSSDTNFVWFLNNPSGALGANTIFFDLWSDNADTAFDFAIGADSPAPFYNFRGRTQFHGATSSMGATIFDTIWNGGNRIATIEVYTETINNNYHMQLFVSKVDSVNYLYRFETVGSGKYDLWSGSWLGYNNMVTALPTTIEMPHIVDYVLPDSLQTIVSEWNCSEKNVTVGNMKNRQGFIDNNLNQYTSPHPNSVGEISPNSSKGPSRHNVIKPDVIAAGDHSLSAGPMWVLANPVYNSVIDSGGWHVANGGTSMASPVVAGIAALYLERCRYTTYQTFLDDIRNTAYTDIFTGVVPNNAYGYGKPDAFAILQELALVGTPVISWSAGNVLNSTSGDNYQWFLDGAPINGEVNQTHTVVAQYGSYEVQIISNEGCSAVSVPYLATEGIDELEVGTIKVFPNPSQSIINFETEEEIIDVRIIDLSGKVIILDSIKNNSIDLSSYKTGTYFLRFTTKNGTSTIKIVNL